MADEAKPLPVADADTTPFWDGARDGRLVLKSCLDCGRAHFYPRALCPHCHSDRLDWIEAKGTGEIHTFTIARRGAGKAFEKDAPYVVAVIALDEGPRMLSNVLTDDVEAVRIGQRVRVTFDPAGGDVALPKFRPVDEPPGRNP
jgi:uncharacterized OB-fold protein